MHKKADHFKGKEAHAHLQEVKAENLTAYSEAHGAESPGHKGAFADALRECAFVLLLLFALLFSMHVPLSLFLAVAAGLLVWKTGRSGWLGWTRLERLHRLIEQERYEIEHHREQEREELVALYQAKGFEGVLLEQIVDHLMSDSDRLLKVMLEEELGLNLEAFEHPLKQAAGAFLGSLLAIVLVAVGLVLFPTWGPFIGGAIALVMGALITASTEQNRVVNAIVWTLSLAALSIGTSFFLKGL